MSDLTDLHDLLTGAPLVDGHNDLLWEMREKAAYDFDRQDISGSVPLLQAAAIATPMAMHHVLRQRRAIKDRFNVSIVSAPEASTSSHSR